MQNSTNANQVWEVIGNICLNLELDETPVTIFEKTRSKYCGDLIDQHCKEGSRVVCFDSDGFFVYVDMFMLNKEFHLINTVELSINVSELSKIADSIIAVIKAWADKKEGGEYYEANDLS